MASGKTPAKNPGSKRTRTPAKQLGLKKLAVAVAADGVDTDAAARDVQTARAVSNAPRPAAAAKKPRAPRNLKAELVALLKSSLRVSVSSGGFTDPNSRVLKLTLDGEELCSTSFDVRSRREYEG